MYERILVALDRSKTAEVVLPYAVEIAAKFGSEIYLVTVAERGTLSADTSYLAYFARVLAQVRRQAESYGVREEMKVHTKTLSGKPANEILRYAEESNADLIGMASHGTSGEGPWVLGNIAAKVLRAAGRPALLIRAPASETALQERRLVKKILAPLDGSKLGEAAIPFIEVLAPALGAELLLFHVVEPVTTWGIYEGYPGYTTPPPDPESRRASAMVYLDGMAKPLKEKGLSVACVVEYGLPARRITDYAKDNAIDLIAMSTHGRSGVGEWVFGSVTDKVLHAGDKPVLVIRPKA